jgi:hypothetical protein
VIAALVALFAASASSRAAADDHNAILDAPAPPTLPALAHRTFVYTFEFTGASIQPNQAQAPEIFGCGGTLAAPCIGGALGWFVHNDLEYPLVSRKWYVGYAHDFAAGSVPGVGDHIFLGNPEIYGRGVWSSLLGFSSGGGLGLVLPTPRHASLQELLVLDTLRVVRPWDKAYFTNLTGTVRPWFDVRHVTGHFVLQLRQGLDVAVALYDLPPGVHRTDLASRTTFYAGYRVTPTIAAGLEVWEVYEITANIPDDQRSAFSMSPSVRFSLGRLEPAVSVIFPVSTPLRGQAASYFGARFNVAYAFDAAGL